MARARIAIFPVLPITNPGRRSHERTFATASLPARPFPWPVATVAGAQRHPRLLSRGHARSKPPFRRVAPGLSGFRLRGIRRAHLRAPGALHGKIRPGNRHAVVQLQGQGRSRHRLAAGDDSHPGPHGQPEGQQPALALALVLSPATVPLRKGPARPLARVLPAQHGHSGVQYHRRRSRAAVLHHPYAQGLRAVG